MRPDAGAARGRRCRFCAAPLDRSVADLGLCPGANHYVRPENRDAPVTFYPLHAFVCDACGLVQLEAFHSPEQLFSDYAYFSSFSETWLAHAEAYAGAVTARLGLGPASRVVEIASNDGYLLRCFVARGIPVTGVEPAANVARAAIEKGVPTRVAFFGRAEAQRMAAEGLSADLVAANNVLAHVPDLNDFVAGLGLLLKPRGVVTVEVPHLLHLVAENQFDTIYHEHFSYFSLATLQRVFLRHGLAVFDVEELATHGGSLRVYACRADALGGNGLAVAAAPARVVAREAAAGLDRPETYDAFAARVRATKRRLLAFLIEAREAGKSVVAYGAAAKGNTLFNYCGIRSDLIDYSVDRSPHKQGLLLPGVHIPIEAPDRIAETRPDFVLIVPWNLKEEIMRQMAHVRSWGGRFVVAVPRVEVLP
ncbi:MAG: class I SAM-dependent methyltransferase [Alphaproteobacteria bacterium]|nr:class I SAM-dependent methyltransferase [Alphaproteobacteria bacterium]